MTKILSVGGSIIVPEKPDTEFLGKFVWRDKNDILYS